ncbi:MAG TPA: hypothetical protein VFA68_02130 [Terriglobales bacterium]|nr:hypothetical protein [Terriglobales bacterium]
MPSIIALLSLLLLASAALTSVVVPNYKDLTIRTHREVGELSSSIDTLYLKGPRERSETRVEKPAASNNSIHIGISQCDQKQSIALNPSARVYARFPIQDWAERIKRAPHVEQNEVSGAEVHVTIDSVDTGERKSFGSFTARHVKTTTEVEPGPGASLPASTEETDGWYIDLPGLGCQESQNGIGFVWSSSRLGNAPARHDRINITHLGTAPHGYALEQVIKRTEDGRTMVGKIELLEFSEAPVDAKLFEIPPGYSPALRTPQGGFDMTKADTFANRLAQFWAELKASAQRAFGAS